MPWRSEAEHATSRSRRLPTILSFTRGWGRNIFCFFKTADTGNRTPNSGVKGSGANHYPRAPAPMSCIRIRLKNCGNADETMLVFYTYYSHVGVAHPGNARLMLQDPRPALGQRLVLAGM